MYKQKIFEYVFEQIKLKIYLKIKLKINADKIYFGIIIELMSPPVYYRHRYDKYIHVYTHRNVYKPMHIFFVFTYIFIL